MYSPGDACFIFLPEKTEGGGIDDWGEKSAKSKSNVILCLRYEVLAERREIVDYDLRSVKELWDELKRMFTTWNQRDISNLRNRFMQISFDKNKFCDNDESNFMNIIDELPAFDQTIIEKEKIVKTIRSLGLSFELLAISSSMTDMTFDH